MEAPAKAPATMKAVVVQAPGDYGLQEVPVPEVAP